MISNNNVTNDNDNQCKSGKILILLPRSVAKRGRNEKSFDAFDVRKRAVHLCSQPLSLNVKCH